MTSTVQEGMNSAGKTAFKVGMATAFAPALISGLAVAPITTIGGLLGAKVGSAVGGQTGKQIGLNNDSTYTKDGTSIIESHPYSGQELGEFIGSTVGAIPGGLAGSAGDAYVAHKTGNDF
jgi:outer membrane lipoprotein SlyB